jgi:hypothetical protein
MGKRIFEVILDNLKKPAAWAAIFTILAAMGVQWSEQTDRTITTMGIVIVDIIRAIVG